MPPEPIIAKAFSVSLPVTSNRVFDNDTGMYIISPLYSELIYGCPGRPGGVKRRGTGSEVILWCMSWLEAENAGYFLTRN